MELNQTRERGQGGFSYLAVAAGLTVLVITAYLSSGFGSRMGWWHFKTGFLILKYGFYGAVVSFVLAMIGIYKTPKMAFSKDLIKSGPILMILLVLIVIPLKWVWKASHVPRIHDITTDLENPPPFKAILPLRAGAPNSASYGGESLASLQTQGYPDIKPLFLSLPPDQAFEKVLEQAEKTRWKIVAYNAEEKRIEATDTTFWFGFKDDIVIRVTPSNGGSRVDFRSLSRVGLSDVGTNAERIRCFISQLSRTS
ncbi:MAG: DUF1499 domain-containing protein [Nitrospirae bacterium]|nr:DUF1499 domain-containing protein [Nitrospirota bacterium]